MMSEASSVNTKQNTELYGPTTPTRLNLSNPQTTHIFRSKLPDIPIPSNLPLHAYCFQKLPELADRPCLISAGRTFTYAETHLQCRKLAAGLSNLGITKGDVIMILLPNSPEFVFSFMAASMLGAVATTANPFYTTAEILKQITASKAKLVITRSTHVDKLPKEALTAVITVDDPPENCLRFSEVSEAEEYELLEAEITADDAVALPFSSGTTGLAKGVILTHKSLVTSVAQQVDGENPNLYLSENDVVLCVLPLFHIFSMHSVMMCALRAGSAIMVVERFEIKALLEGIERERVTVAMVVPPMVVALAKDPRVEEYDLSSIRLVMSGAAPLGKDLEDALRSRLPRAVLGQVSDRTLICYCTNSSTMVESET